MSPGRFGGFVCPNAFNFSHHRLPPLAAATSAPRMAVFPGTFSDAVPFLKQPTNRENMPFSSPAIPCTLLTLPRPQLTARLWVMWVSIPWGSLRSSTSRFASLPRPPRLLHIPVRASSRPRPPASPHTNATWLSSDAHSIFFAPQVLREAELKHGRIAMLATLGLLVQEQYVFPFFDKVRPPPKIRLSSPSAPTHSYSRRPPADRPHPRARRPRQDRWHVPDPPVDLVRRDLRCHRPLPDRTGQARCRRLLLRPPLPLRTPPSPRAPHTLILPLQAARPHALA